jgi:hypothetical protein
LATIEEGAEVNQNAFSSINVGEETISASTSTDNFELAGGSNIVLSVNPTAKRITINGIGDNDTKYELEQPDSSTVKLVGTDGSESSVTVSGENTTYELEQPDASTIRLTGSDGSTSDITMVSSAFKFTWNIGDVKPDPAEITAAGILWLDTSEYDNEAPGDSSGELTVNRNGDFLFTYSIGTVVPDLDLIGANSALWFNTSTEFLTPING